MTVTYFKIAHRDLSSPWDVSRIATNIQWTTDIDFAAGELKFTLLEINEGFFPHNGDAVSFQWDGNKTFFGYIFSYSYKSDETIEITAYDRLRYLKNQDTILWPVGTALQRFNAVMGRISAPHQNLSNNAIKLPAEVADGKTYFDMLKSAFDSTYSRSGHRYIIRDNYGMVQLLRVVGSGNVNFPSKTNLVLGDNSLLTDFTFEKSIDELYNVVKLIKETENKQKRTVYTTKTAASTSSRKKFGTLQIVEKADEKLNASQMQAKANQFLRQYNKEKMTLSLNAIGNNSLRAGSRFYISIQSLRDIGIGTREVLATKVTHDFSDNWTMSLDVEIL